ncbi:VOC family protein [Deinococcus pimensis]|uniref:VOC family protein n=1 Tax=Deinococcus pimensis TaxID=309888 RepID=UPI0004B207F0|nr:VOC family protein [Deinococcus pimensis]
MFTQESPGSSWVSGIYAVTAFTEDLQATRQFYLHVFGLPVVFEDEHSVVFQFGSTLINLLRVSEADALVAPAKVGAATSGARMVFTIHVQDVDALCAELVERGVTLLNGPLDRPWGVRTASFRDPAGIIWEIAKQA